MGSVFRVVGQDFLTDLQGKIGFIEGNWNAIGQPNAMNPNHPLSSGEGEFMRHSFIRSHNLLAHQPSCWLASERLHVLHKSGQLGEFLCDFGCRDERTLAALNLDQAAADKVLNSPAHGNAANLKPRNEIVFGRKLVAWLERSVGDLGSQHGFDPANTAMEQVSPPS